jgi:hypothetical protein
MRVLPLLMAAVYLCKIPDVYDSYKECAVAASEISIVALNSMNKDMVNKEQIFFGFSCVEANTI